MDANVVYRKTLAGEEAMRLRTLVVQRNQRMVLTLIDGQARVADLNQKIGNAQLVEAALRELERGGFIEPDMGQPSAWNQTSNEERDRVIRAADAAMESFSTFGSRHSALPANSQFSIAPVDAIQMPGADDRGTDERFTSTGSWTGPLVPEETQLDKMKMWWANRQVEKGHGGRGLSFGRVVLYLVFLLILGAGAAVVFFPYDNYRKEMESFLSSTLNTQVKIGGIEPLYTQNPGVVLSDIQVGPWLKVRQITLRPRLSSLVSEHKTYSSISFSGAEMDLKVVPTFGAWLKTWKEQFSVGRFDFERMGFTFDQIRLENWGGELEKEDNEEKLKLFDSARSLRLTFRNLGAGKTPAVDFEINGWKPGGGLLIDGLSAKLTMDGDRLRLDGIDGRLLDGYVDGQAVVGGDGSVQGHLGLRRISLRRLSELGEMVPAGEGDVSMDLEVAGHLAPNTWALDRGSLSGSFTMQRGALQGIDLVGVVRQGQGTAAAASTRFEQMSGSVRGDFHGVRYGELVLQSGLFRATGLLEYTHRQTENRVDGGFLVQMRGSSNQVQAAVQVNGPARRPNVVAR